MVRRGSLDIEEETMLRSTYQAAKRLFSFGRDEAAQDAFEYVLIIGVVVVAVLIAIATPIGNTLINAVLTGVCSAVDSMTYISVSC